MNAESIAQAASSQFYLLQQLGPLGFLIKSGENKYKVGLGSVHSCSCRTDLCIHILWVLLKVMHVPADSELLQKKTLADREVDSLLVYKTSFRSKSKITKQDSSTTLVDQRGVSEDDVW